jgi:hypothetical protein
LQLFENSSYFLSWQCFYSASRHSAESRGSIYQEHPSEQSLRELAIGVLDKINRCARNDFESLIRRNTLSLRAAKG